MNLPETGRCQHTSVDLIALPPVEDLLPTAGMLNLDPEGPVCSLFPYPVPDQHNLQRRAYCQWLKGELSETHKYERPDSRLSLGELGVKYQSTLGGMKCVLIDLSGTLHIGNKITEDAVDALAALRTLGPMVGLEIRFVTNTTKESKRLLLERIRGLGFQVGDDELYTSLTAARKYCEDHELRPLLIIDDKAKEEFEGFDTHCLNTVLVGLNPSEFNYTDLTKPFRLLMGGAKLVGVHKGRYHKGENGMALGPGPFIRMLEYASDQEAVIMGKPEPEFFKTAVASTKFSLSKAVMIGDDVRDDVAGAMAIGMKGILVQTGKYRPGDERELRPRSPDVLCKNFSVAVRCIIGSVLVKNHLPTGDEKRPIFRVGARKIIHEPGILSGPEFLEKMSAYANVCGYRPDDCTDEKSKDKHLDELLDFAVYYTDE